MGLFLPKLDKTMQIGQFEMTNPTTGKRETVYVISTPQLQRFWQTNSLRLDGAATLAGVPETAEASYSQSQFQAVLDFCNDLKRGLS